MTTTPLTPLESKWSERVDAWRASGQGAPEFAQGKGFAASSLKKWADRLRRKGRRKFARVVRQPRAVAAAPELVIEIGSARVRIVRGFDAEMLADVVRALGAATVGAR